MSYDFGSLSPADFEDLARDLVGRELGVRFEAFAPGPDGGVDGRHATGSGAIILQAKHYAGSTYAALRSKMKRERKAIDRLSPARYILTTSRPLTPRNKAQLAGIIGPSLQREADILGPGDVNTLIRKYPDIEKSHIKLWLTGSAILERVVRSAAYNFNYITRTDIESKVRVYAPNPSFNDARDKLEGSHVVIISGPPGVGKTTLAEMLSYAYIAEGWELAAIRSLDDGFALIDDTKKQVFFFDDFLGKVALDRRALSHKDSDLARFIKRTRSSPNARFILTTRAYIFEEARRVSEHLADQHLDISKYVLDVGVYTRRIKARILYNHLLVARTPQAHITALVQSGHIAEIVDHQNYNPRIIEWMTDVTRIGALEPEAYPAAFLDALAHPRQLWDTAFRTHISKTCQHLLFALFFSSSYGVSIDNLKVAYDGLHPHLCAKYGEAHDPKDFEEALRILEGGFIAVTGRNVQFVNPSLRDYLTEYLNDLMLLSEFAHAARQTDWAQAVWQHATQLKPADEDLWNFALSFLNIAEHFLRLPVWKRVQDGTGYSLYPAGLSNTDRIELLIAWWEASRDQRFADLAFALAGEPVDGLDSWRDGEQAVELIAKLRDGWYDDFPRATEMADHLEEAFIDMMGTGLPLDELENISNAANRWNTSLGKPITDAIRDAVSREIDDAGDAVSEMDSHSTLEDRINTLQNLAERTGIPPQNLERAVRKVTERIDELKEKTSEPKSPSFNATFPTEADAFDDEALKNLFASLVDL